MNIDTLIKDAYTIEVEHNRSKTPPPKQIPLPLKRDTPKKGGVGVWYRTVLAACIMIALFFAALSMKDPLYERHTLYRTAGISVIFPEDPAQSLYNFLFAIRSSYEE
ncbi:MAG: hypothetical protein LBP19_00745 [Treponema sp.]|jgi:hypothetical protein|nr:hypothetical protein [Treponema sp.]